MTIEIKPTLAGDWLKFTPFTPEDFDVETRPAVAKFPGKFGVAECRAWIVLRLKDHVATQFTGCVDTLPWWFVTCWLHQIVNSVHGGGYEAKALSVGKTTSFLLELDNPDALAWKQIADAVTEANSLFDDVPSVAQQRVDKLNETIQIGVEKHNAKLTEDIEED